LLPLEDPVAARRSLARGGGKGEGADLRPAGAAGRNCGREQETQMSALAHPALVTRPCPEDDAPTYLQVSPLGYSVWVDDPGLATAFASMREAARAALRLPAELRAFGLPRTPELALRSTH
jgi:hypothetical protein